MITYRQVAPAPPSPSPSPPPPPPPPPADVDGQGGNGYIAEASGCKDDPFAPDKEETAEATDEAADGGCELRSSRQRRRGSDDVQLEKLQTAVAVEMSLNLAPFCTRRLQSGASQSTPTAPRDSGRTAMAVADGSCDDGDEANLSSTPTPQSGGPDNEQGRGATRGRGRGRAGSGRGRARGMQDGRGRGRGAAPKPSEDEVGARDSSGTDSDDNEDCWFVAAAACCTAAAIARLALQLQLRDPMKQFNLAEYLTGLQKRVCGGN